MDTSDSKSSSVSSALREIRNELKSLSREIRDLGGGFVSVVDHPVDTLDFYRLFVAASRPAIIRGATQGWPALERWRGTEYLQAALPHQQVTVAVTPNGRADAVTPLDSAGQLCFALPHESQMPLPALLDRLADKSSDTVIYAQAQNSSLQEFGQLREDIDAELAWAAKIFGQPAEATNLWIGDSRSVTSLHSDPYENMYAVITGQKRFTLLPPADAHRLCKRRLPVACWEPGEQGLQLRLQEPLSCCSWCPIDRDVMRPQCRADEQQQELYPAMFDPELPEPISVLVGLGDMLYLPAFWHHQVEQLDDDNGRVIACNWWFDTQFTGAVATAQFVERVAQLADESVQS